MTGDRRFAPLNPSSMPGIRMLGDAGGPRDAMASVVLVGGPDDGVRLDLPDPPAAMPAEGGTYLRSVRCADDGALRYVFEPAAGPAETSRTP